MATTINSSTNSSEKTTLQEPIPKPPPRGHVGPERERPYRRIDLLSKFLWLGRILKARSFQFLVVLPNLVIFYIFLIAGIFGSPVGNRNIIIVFVWILWWFLLIAIMVPFFSRIWCLVCPFPFFGEWLQRGRLIGVRSGRTKGLRNKLFGLNKRWPKKLSNIWLQIFCSWAYARSVFHWSRDRSSALSF